VTGRDHHPDPREPDRNHRLVTILVGVGLTALVLAALVWATLNFPEACSRRMERLHDEASGEAPPTP